MSTIWYTSDPHIDHKLVAGTRGFLEAPLPEGMTGERARDWFRKYGEPYHMASKIAEAWDSVVAEDDIVFVLGDVGMSKFNDVVLPWFDLRPGTIHLVAGNHDPVHPTRSDAVKLQPRWLETFATINPYLTRKIAGKKVALSHFPFASFADGDDPEHGEEGGRWVEFRVPETKDKLLLHGHTHGPEKAHGNQLHVGWDAWGRLVRHDEVEAWVESRS